MQVLVLPSWYSNTSHPNGGIFFKEQAKALKNNGLDVSILYVDLLRWGDLLPNNVKSLAFRKSFAIEDTIPTYRINGFNLISARYEVGRKIWFRLTLQLFEHFLKKEGKPDLIHAHSYWGGYVAALIKQKYGIPYILTEHSSNLFNISNVEWHQKYIKRAFQETDSLSAVSERLAIEMQQFTDKQQIQIIPNFIDTDFFSPVLSDSPKEKIILTIGNLVAVKNQQMLIQAFYQSDLASKGWVLRIGGKGKLRTKLKEQISDLGLIDSVQLLGELTRKQVKLELEKARFFALSSHVETFGVVLIEAMAMGLPVLTTKCGGPERIVQPELGLVVENDLASLTRGIVQMQQQITSYDPSFIRDLVVKHYSNSGVVHQLLHIYKNIKMALA